MKFVAADVGNTRIHFAFYENKKWVSHYSVSSRLSRKKIERALSKHFQNLSGIQIAIASVVPQLGIFLKNYFKKRGAKTTLIGKDISVPIVNRYQNPKQVGVDRLLNAYAAFEQYKKEIIVIDFGTAITFDVVSRKGEYLGGVIAPGIEISLEALFQKTALLPKIKLQHPKNWIGRDTAESIRVGCSVGIGGLCDRVIEAISKKYGMKPLVIATGGYASFMKPYCRRIQKIDPYLILQGIRLTFTHSNHS